MASNAQLGSELRVDPGAEVSASNQETGQEMAILILILTVIAFVRSSF